MLSSTISRPEPEAEPLKRNSKPVPGPEHGFQTLQTGFFMQLAEKCRHRL